MLLAQVDGLCAYREAIAGAIVALQAANAVIAGPFSADNANARGLLPHLADLAGNAYCALRPPGSSSSTRRSHRSDRGFSLSS
jgi:hypothetical protein